ncbi:MAG TPA: hypothetical protein VK338_02505 [Candidatus Nitrosocosmicus sp.]|nr:hypothetical protein [Candidatus Nitrosocosmicus sp.]
MKPKKHTSPVKSSTQEFVAIEQIKDDIVLMKDNSCCIVVHVGTTNFGLLSQEEQNSMVYSYGSLLNSLSFPVQVLILSKRMDISSYLDYLEAKIKTQLDLITKANLEKYMEFIKNVIKNNVVLEKKFYFVIPFSPLELGVTGTAGKHLNKEYIMVRAKASLYPKKDHLLRLLKKIGLGGRELYEQELTELFYNLYNPSASGRKLAPMESYTNIISTAK